MDWLAKPSTMVNRFRIKSPETYSDRYVYVPGDSFHWPGDQAKINVDIDPARYNAPGVDIESGTYVLQGPAFFAWLRLREQVCIEPGELPGFSAPLEQPPWGSIPFSPEWRWRAKSTSTMPPSMAF